LKKTVRKRLINFIVLSGVFGFISLIFDQLAIQQETEIRRLETLYVKKSMNRQMLSDYNHHLVITSKNVQNFADQSVIRLSNLNQIDEISDFRKERDFEIEDGFLMPSLLVKDLEYFSKLILSLVKENYQRINRVDLGTEQVKQMVDSIVNQDFDIDRKTITIGEVWNSLDKLRETSKTLSEISSWLHLEVVELGKEAQDLNAKASKKRSYKQRFLLLGTICQILSLMFLLIFFRVLYSIQREIKEDT